jgi:phospholipase C
MTKILTATIIGLLITSLFVSSSIWAVAGDDTKTPIKHVVVIFQENISYDHYFGTYPQASIHAGEPNFTAASGTPNSNGLTPALLTHNPNLYNPFRLDRTQAITCDEDHNYLDEQKAYDGGLMDMFVQKTGIGEVDENAALGHTVVCPTTANPTSGNLTMGYYDGNTVTGIWNYAQNFAMSDNSYDTEFGPSTPGAVDLISGDTNGATNGATNGNIAGGAVIGDPDPTFDDCSCATTVSMTVKNVGDTLNKQGITWGWFEGGFKPTLTNNGKAVCGATTPRTATDNVQVAAYSAHHEPFEYYLSTSNPHHLSPTSVSMIGHTDQANHQYDLSDFWNAVNSGNMPAVSYLKAPRAQDGHPGNSNPLDEQVFLVNTINKLEQTPEWSSTAVFLLYDDSDGWYDHAKPPIVNHSNDPVNDAAICAGHPILGDQDDRCGHGPRQPLLVISPYAKSNFISHEVSDQTSTLKFILDNWHLDFDDNTSFVNNAGSLNDMFDFSMHHTVPQVFLDNMTGEVTSIVPTH